MASSRVPLNQLWAEAEETRTRTSDKAAIFLMVTSMPKIAKDVLLVKKNWIFAAIFKGKSTLSWA